MNVNKTVHFDEVSSRNVQRNKNLNAHTRFIHCTCTKKKTKYTQCHTQINTEKITTKMYNESDAHPLIGF